MVEMNPETPSSPSPDLKPLLDAVGRELGAEEVRLARLKGALERLLAFLSTRGRTDANCRAVEQYLWDTEAWLALDTLRLPDGYRSILFDMGAQLHDTISAPEIAENFESTPEQLLARLRSLAADEPRSQTSA